MTEFVVKPSEWSVKVLRQDYTLAYKEMLKERSEAQALAEAIAARHPRDVHSWMKVKLKKKPILPKWLRTDMSRVIRNARSYASRKNGIEVDKFNSLCYHQDRVEVDDFKQVCEYKPFPALPTSVKQIKRKSDPINSSQLREQPENICSEVVTLNRAKRFTLLMNVLSKTDCGQTLGMAIVHTMAKRAELDLDYVSQLLSGQMDNEPQVSNNTTVVDQRADVVLKQSSEIETGIPSFRSQGYRPQAVSTDVSTISRMTDRWIMYDTYVWSTSSQKSSEIFTIRYPTDIYRKCLNSPNLQPFLTNRYNRTDIKFKFVLNSNVFQVGSLLIDNYYAPYGTITTGHQNLYSASQRNHVILQAGPGNDAILVVPYQYPNSVMGLTKPESSMGVITGRVLNQLTVTEGVSTQCRLSVFVTFENSSFHGSISRSIGVAYVGLDGLEAQMDTIAHIANIGANVLSTLASDPNRDNPPVPIQPISFIPQALSSMSYVDGIGDPVNVLRANAIAQTPHCSTVDEMQYIDVCKVFGYFKTVDMTVKSENVIYSVPVSPMLPRGEYESFSIADSTSKARVYPPVAVISSLFGKWHGDILFKLHIVCSKFHNATIACGFLPGIITTSDELNTPKFLDAMKYSPYQVTELNGPTEIVFSCPWFWLNAWANTSSFSNFKGDQIGTFYIRVINPLICIDSVPPKVPINLFMAASSSFELTLPRPTSLGLTQGPPVQPPKNQYLTPYNTENAWYTTWERNLDAGGDKFMQTIYIQNITDGWVGYLGLKDGKVYVLNGLLKSDRLFKCVMSVTLGNITTDEPIGYGCADPSLQNSNAHGLIVFPNSQAGQDDCRSYSKKIMQARTLSQKAAVRAKFPQYFYSRDGPWSTIDGVVATNDGDYPLWEEMEFLEAQMDDRVVDSITLVSTPAASVGSGLATFGEKISSLKSLCRRYNHYCSLVGSTCSLGSPRDCCYLAKISLHPVRVLDIKTSISYDNRLRQGSTSLISSGYLGYRGGLRLRFVVTGLLPQGSTLFVQHKYDELSSSTDPMIQYGVKVKSAEDLLATQYATFAQILDVNGSCTIEIPYYRETEFCLTSQTTNKDFWSIGKIYVWVHSLEVKPIKVEVYYSIADDLSFKVFQGFPYLYDLTEIKDEPTSLNLDDLLLEPQMEWYSHLPEPDIDYEFYNPNKGTSFMYASKQLSELVMKKYPDAYRAERKLQPDGIEYFSLKLKSLDPVPSTSKALEPNISSPLKYLKNMSFSVEKVAENSTVLTSSVKEAATEITSTISKLKKVVDTIGSESKDRIHKLKHDVKKNGIAGIFQSGLSASFGYLTHLIYALINPTIETISWALVNLYKKVFGFTFLGVEKFFTAIKKIWYKVNPTKQPQGTTLVEDDNKLEPNGFNEDCPTASLASLLFATISTLVKFKVTPPTSWKGISDGLFSFGLITRGASSVSMFIKDNLTLFKRVHKKFVSMLGFSSDVLGMVNDVNDQRLKKWMIEALTVVSKINEDKVLTQVPWANKVFELNVIGMSFQVQLLNKNVHNNTVVNMFTQLLNKLASLEKKLINNKIYCGVKYEPYCFWLCGDAGTGKSRFLESLTTTLATNSGYTGHKQYYAHTFGQKYFDGLRDEPTMLWDDFMSFTPSMDPESYIQFLQLKGPTLFNPPFAQADEKDRLTSFKNLLISAQSSHFSNMSGIHDFDAYNRRRDLVIKFERRSQARTAKDLQGNPIILDSRKVLKDQLEIDYMRTLDGVDAYIIINVLDEQSSKLLIDSVVGEDYNLTVLRKVNESSQEYHVKESQNFEISARRVSASIKACIKPDDNIETYLEKVAKEFEEHAEGNSKTIKSFFSTWLKKASTEAGTLEPQGDDDLDDDLNNPFYQDIDITGPEPRVWEFESTEMDNTMNCKGNDDSGVGSLVNPRKNLDPVSVRNCAHTYLDKPGYLYDPKTKLFDLYDLDSDLPQCIPISPCRKRLSSDDYETLTYCIFTDKLRREKYLKAYTFNQIKDNTALTMLLDTPSLANKDTIKDAGLTDDFMFLFKEKIVREDKFKMDPAHEERVRRLMMAFTPTLTTKRHIFGYWLDTERPPLKIPRPIWKLAIKVMELLRDATVLLLRFVFVFSLASLAGYGVTKAIGLTGQVHPSGDHKTIRSEGSMRSKALNLLTQNNDKCVEIDTDKDIIKSISSLSVHDHSLDGQLHKIKRNSFYIIGIQEVKGNRVATYQARCLGLKGRKFLVLKHYYEHFKSIGVSRIAIVMHGSTAVLHYNLDDLQFSWTKQGYGIGILPSSFPITFSNIVRYMPSQNFDGGYPKDCLIFEVFNDNVTQIPIRADLLTRSRTVPANATQSSWVIEQGFQYSWGGKGKCGSLLICPSMACPLVGVHTAGIGDVYGISELLLKETFEDEEIEVEFVVPQMDITENVASLEGEYMVIGQLPSDMQVKTSQVTKIIPSNVSPVFPLVTEPAPLSYKDIRLKGAFDPLYEGVKKRCDKTSEFPIDLVNTAYQHLVEKLVNVVKPLRTLTPMTVLEAVNGFEALKGYDKIVMSTSEGYPWVKMRPSNSTSKAWLFNINLDSPTNEVLGIHKDLNDVLKYKTECREKGIVPLSYFTCCTKDSRISKSKILTPGKTRIFEISPICLTIANRQLQLDFNAAYQNARLDAENTIGINPDGPEWTDLADRLINFSPHILTADYSGYGPRMNHSILERSFDVSNAWYVHNEDQSEDINSRMFIQREVLKFEVMKAPHLYKSLVFRPVAGLPSGCSDTVHLNSRANSLYIRVAFLALARENAPHLCDLYWFDKYVLLFHNGDDLIMSVKPEIIDWFNNLQLIEYFLRYNLKMTDSLKSGVIKPYCTIWEATYLKRGFLKHPFRENEFLAPLEEDSITDTANWIWKSLDSQAASLVNSEMCARLAYTRGPNFYNDVVRKLKVVWKEKGVRFQAPSWESLDSHIWCGTVGPIFSF